MDEPGSFAGITNSPIPDLGPEANILMSLAILLMDTANCFKAPCVSTIASWAASLQTYFQQIRTANWLVLQYFLATIFA